MVLSFSQYPSSGWVLRSAFCRAAKGSFFKASSRLERSPLHASCQEVYPSNLCLCGSLNFLSFKHKVWHVTWTGRRNVYTVWLDDLLIVHLIWPSWLTRRWKIKNQSVFTGAFTCSFLCLGLHLFGLSRVGTLLCFECYVKLTSTSVILPLFRPLSLSLSLSLSLIRKSACFRTKKVFECCQSISKHYGKRWKQALSVVCPDCCQSF